MSKVQSRAGAAVAARLAYFFWRLSLDLVGIARAAKGDVTPSQKNFTKSCGDLPARVHAKVRTDAILLRRFRPAFCWLKNFSGPTVMGRTGSKRR